MAEQLNDNQDETYDKLIQMVQEGINHSDKEMEKVIDRCRERNKALEDEIKALRTELDTEKWR